MRKVGLLVVLAVLVFPVAAAASPRLSVPRAQAAIRHHEGTGTTIARCWRLSRRAVECRYQTQAVNKGIGTAEEGWTFEGWDIAHAAGRHVTVTVGEPSY